MTVRSNTYKRKHSNNNRNINDGNLDNFRDRDFEMLVRILGHITEALAN